MRVFVLASLLIACGTTTFTAEEGGTTMMPADGSVTEASMTWPGCTGSCVQVAAVDFPTCLEANTGSLFYATDGPGPTVGKVDKTTFAVMTTALGVAAADCTLYGLALLVAGAPGNVATFNASLMPGPFYAMGPANMRITSRLLVTPYVAAIRADGLWGCDGTPTPNCRNYASVGPLSAIATDGEFIYYATDKVLARNATNAAAVAEPLAALSSITALTLDINSVIFATSNDTTIWSIPKVPPGQPKKLTDTTAGVRWLTNDASGIYWSTTDRIYGSHKDGNSVSQYADRQSNPIRVLTDDTYIYWINHVSKMSGGGIYRMKK